MATPAIATRTVLLVALVGIGFVIAGGGNVGAVDTGGQETAPAATLDTAVGDPPDVVPKTVAPVLRPPGASVQPFPLEQAKSPRNDTGDGGSAGNNGQAESGSTGNDGNENPDSSTTDTEGSSTDKAAAATPIDNGEEADDAPGQSGGNGGSPEQPPNSGTDTSAGPPDNGGAEQNPGTGSPPADPGPNNGQGNGSPEAGATGNNSTGPPEWVDAPSGPGNESFSGPPAGAADVPNGTSRTISVGNSNVTITVGQGPPAEVPGARVVAHVANATPNASVPVDLPRAGNDSVQTERLSVTVTDRQDFSLGVSTKTERDVNRTPAFEPEGKAKGLGYISVDHTVPDSEIEGVTFRFAVDADRITPSERGDVALYRHHNGSWNEVPTTYVARNDTAYVFEAESPGLSEFTVGKKLPAFEISEARLLSSVQTTADPVSVRVRITNEGDADGVYTARLLLNEQAVGEEQLSIAAGGTRQTSFEESIEEPGEYRVLVNNHTVGQLDVEAAAVDSKTDTVTPVSSTLAESSASDSSGDNGTADGETMTEMRGFGIFAGVLGLVLVALTRRQRSE